MPAATSETHTLNKVLLLLLQERLTCHQIGKAAKMELHSYARWASPCVASASLLSDLPD